MRNNTLPSRSVEDVGLRGGQLSGFRVQEFGRRWEEKEFGGLVGVGDFKRAPVGL